MKYLRISNKGLIEAEALHLMGASTKVGDESKIGQFGSGNKYAIAYLMRNGMKPIIFSGTNEIELTTKVKSFRGVDMEIVCLDGQPTSITTQMGKDWKLWQAIREIVCNAMDEGAYGKEIVEDIGPIEGATSFFIPLTDELNTLLENWEQYFYSEDRILFQHKGFRVLRKIEGACNIYRRGVRCHDSEMGSAFDYDLPEVSIDEDRLNHSSYERSRHVWEGMSRCTSPTIIRKFIHFAQNGGFESEECSCLTDLTHATVTFIEEIRKFKWVRVSTAIRMHNLDDFFVVADNTYASIDYWLEDENRSPLLRKNLKVYEVVFATELQIQTVKKAREFFSECQFDIPYEIEFVKFYDKDIMGSAIDGKIQLSAKHVERGVQETVNTILEEYIHLKHEVADETRRFQTVAIGELINYMKQVNSFIL